MTGQLLPASITPYDSQGRNVESDQAIVFDFNPESLQIQAKSGQESDRGRQGRQQVQHVSRTHATLTFDAVFDTTRPNPQRQGPQSGAQDESLDVRHKTAALGSFVRDEPSRRNRAPRRIQFRWGSIVFNGVMTTFSETLDYFSPSGVPLRSKVSITIIEQEFRYEVQPSPQQPVRQGNVANDTGALGRRNDVDTLDDLLEGSGFNLAAGIDAQLEAKLDLSLSLEASLDVNLSASLGLSADFDLDLRAGVDLGVSAAADVFGIDAVVGLGASVAGGFGSAAARIDIGATPLIAPSKPPTVWAPQGLGEGSRSIETARAVVEARHRGNADRVRPAGFQRDRDVTVAPEESSGRAPVPVRGMPPVRVPVFGEVEATVYSRDRGQGPLSSGLSGRRPRWEILPIDGRSARPNAVCTCGCNVSSGCGCRGGTR